MYARRLAACDRAAFNRPDHLAARYRFKRGWHSPITGPINYANV